MTKKRWVIIGIIGTLVLLLVLGFVIINPSNAYDGAIAGINLANVSDGVHTGTFEDGRFTNTLNVHVENGVIIRIEIINDVVASFITNASEETFARVIAAQDTRIDVVSGSTITTNAYLRAIENALKN